MKLLLIGDAHLRMKAPAKRTETDFMVVCLGKLRQIVKIFKEYGCDVAIQVGDFYDSANPSGELVAETIDLLRTAWSKGGFDLLAIHGQHDQLYHTEASMKRSALRIMEAAGVVDLLHPDEPTKLTEGVHVYGASFGQDPIVPLVPAEFNILVAHAMVGDKPLFPGHEITGPHQYAAKHPGYNLYVLGDYHYPFSVAGEGYDVVNPGCLIRKSVSDIKHKPKVVLYDTDNPGGAEDIYLDVADPEVCFDLTEDEAPKDSPALAELAARLAASGSVGVSFTDTLQQYFDEQGTNPEIKDLIWQNLEAETV